MIQLSDIIEFFFKDDRHLYGISKAEIKKCIVSAIRKCPPAISRSRIFTLIDSFITIFYKYIIIQPHHFFADSNAN